MVKKHKIKIFLGLSEISGLYQGLAEGFRQLGIKTTRLDLSNHPYQYSQQRAPWLVRLFHRSQSRLKRKTIGYLFWKILALTSKFLLFIQALITHQVFIFSYATSFFKLWDLYLLKLCQKKIIFQFHGSDSRPPYMDGSFIPHYSPGEIAKMTALKKRQIAIINRIADAVIDIPPMGLFHEKKFINWLQVGLTVSVTQSPNTTSFCYTDDTINILHAPSNSLFKGTQLIERAIHELTNEGYRIAFTKVQNQTHQKVREALLRCDFVIDQLFADYPMPGFATESAWFNKPVLICGYAKDLWSELLSSDILPPTHYCHPDELIGSIKLLCNDQKYRLTLGEKAFHFVSTKWSPIEVAKRYLRIIENDVPDEWLCDPASITYTHGCGIHENALKNFLQHYINQQGLSALMLQDKPWLQENFLKFAGAFENG